MKKTKVSAKGTYLKVAREYNRVCKKYGYLTGVGFHRQGKKKGVRDETDTVIK